VANGARQQSNGRAKINAEYVSLLATLEKAEKYNECDQFRNLPGPDG
jgi:hypothetical protein